MKVLRKIAIYAGLTLPTLYLFINNGVVQNYIFECLKNTGCVQIPVLNSLIENFSTFRALVSFEWVGAFLSIILIFSIVFHFSPKISKLNKNIKIVGLKETLIPTNDLTLMLDREELWENNFNSSSPKTKIIHILGMTGEMTFSSEKTDDVGKKSEAAPLRSTLDTIPKNVEVRVLLLSPASEHYFQRVKSLMSDKSEVEIRRELSKFLSQTKNAINYLKQKRREGHNVEWRFYDRPPIWKLILTDTFVWQQIYPSGLHVERSQTNIFVPGHTTEAIGLFSGFKAIFDLLWEQYEKTPSNAIPKLFNPAKLASVAKRA